MAVICVICASPSLRARVDADVVRRRTLSSIAQDNGLSSRSVRRHVAHLPERIEADASTSEPSIYIGSVTLNYSVFAWPSEEEEPSEVVDDAVEEGGGGSRK
jgi:hypothetical protein